MLAYEVGRLMKWESDARLYRLDPHPEGYEYVVVSAVMVPYGGGPETYIFRADAQGNVLDWSELEGSLRGSLDHAEALRGAGYGIAPTVVS